MNVQSCIVVCIPKVYILNIFIRCNIFPFIRHRVDNNLQYTPCWCFMLFMLSLFGQQVLATSWSTPSNYNLASTHSYITRSYAQVRNEINILFCSIFFVLLVNMFRKIHLNIHFSLSYGIFIVSLNNICM